MTIETNDEPGSVTADDKKDDNASSARKEITEKVKGNFLLVFFLVH